MNTAALIKQAAQAGVFLYVDKGKLGFKLSAESFPAELKAQLVAAKAQIIEHLLLLQQQNKASVRPAVEKRPQGLEQLPPSFGQQRMWFIDQLEGSSSHYNIAMALKVNSDFNIDAADLAMSRIISRHEVLRTVLVGGDEAPVQVISTEFDFAFKRLDLSHLPCELRDEQLGQLIAADSATPFDLANDLMVRGSFVQLSKPDESPQGAILLNMHHIASDGGSMQVLMDEFTLQYEAACQNLPDPLPPLAIQYADYAWWQRQFLQGDVLAKQMNYWQQQLAGLPVCHALPLDNLRPQVKGHKGDELLSHVDGTLATALFDVSKIHQLTPFVLMHGLFALLLSRHANETDIVLGTPVANRLDQQLTPLIGFFANTLILRVDTAKANLDEYLAGVKTVNLDAQAHQDVPFEHLVEHLNLARTTAYTPLFQILFTADLVDSTPDAAQPDGALSMLSNDHVAVKFDLEVAFQLSKQGIEVKWVFDTDLFERASIEQLDQNLRRLFESVCNDPHGQLAQLNYLSPSQIQRQVYDFNPALSAPKVKHQQLVHQLFETQAKAKPEHIVLSWQQQDVSYAALNYQANQLACHLRTLGVKAGSLVGICLKRNVDLVVSLLAVLKAGGAYVPLDASYPTERLTFMIEDTQLSLLLTQSEAMGNLPALDNVELLMLNQLSPAFWADLPGDDLAPCQSADSLAYVIYTSGSTGKPKGVLVTQHNVLALLHWAQGVFDHHSAKQVLATTSLNFDLSVFELFFPLCFGHRCILVDDVFALLNEAAPEQFSEQSVAPTLLNTVPSAVKTLLTQQAIAQSVNTVNLCGEPLDADTVNQLLALDHIEQVYNLYGPSEDTVYSTAKCFRQPISGTPSIGKVINGTSGFVLAHDGALLPIGTVGELYLGGAGVSQGYLNRQALTDERFIDDLFSTTPGQKLYRSGDLVRLLDDGQLAFIGRSDHQMKIRGFRIEPGEIEHQILSVDSVERAVIVIDNSTSQPRLIAYVVSSSRDNSDLVANIRAVLSQRLPSYMMPAVFMLLEQFPYTLNGKVDVKALPAPDATANQDNYVAAQSPIEQGLVELWAKLLKLDDQKLGVNSNFFELGGDSILSIQLVSQAAKQGWYFSVKDLFLAQTIKQLAAVVNTAVQVEAPQQAVTGTTALLPIAVEFFSDLSDWHHYNQAVVLHPPKNLPEQPFDLAILTDLITKLVERHDVLRLTFEHGENGWQGRFLPLSAERLSDSVSSAHLSNFDQALEDFANQTQRSLDPANGRLFKVVYLSADDVAETLLLVVVHHLVIDGVSWRIMLQDLETLFDQNIKGEALQLPAKTSGFHQWVDYLYEFAHSPSFDAQLDYWQQALSIPVNSLVNDNGCDDNKYDRQSVGFNLNAKATTKLLSACHQAYHTKINELLLAALLLGVYRTFGHQAIRVDLEGHGREHLSDSLDLSETLGWFTVMYPLTLSEDLTIEGQAQLKRLICGVKEQYRAVPLNGIGFGLGKYVLKQSLFAVEPSDMVFNYLGQFDQLTESDNHFKPAAKSAADNASAKRSDPHPMMFDGMVANGELGLRLSYLASLFDAGQMGQLINAIEQSLNDIIDHCTGVQQRHFTPSDFPLAAVNSATLDQWQLQLQQKQQKLQNLYPATGMQQGMLFHSLLDGSNYVSQTVLTIDDLDLERFKQAWQLVIEHHQIFRTTFVGLDTQQPHQLVQQQANMRWYQYDISDKSTAQQHQYIDEFLLQDKNNGIDLSCAPLMHMNVFKLGDKQHSQTQEQGKQSLEIIWSYHHALLDGWCIPMVFAQVTACYQSLIENTTMQWPQAPEISDYVAWLSEQDQSKDQQFWQQYLADIEGVTPLPLVASHSEQQAVSFAVDSHFIQFDQDITAELVKLAQNCKTTVNVLVQGAWALLLANYSNESKVVFGATTSGRPPQLPDVEQMIGLFINTVPSVVEIQAEQSLQQWFGQLHQQLIEREQHSHLPLSQIQRQASFSGSLFNSLLIFENFPSDDAIGEKAASAQLQVTGLQTFEQTTYPLTLLANLTDRLTIKVDVQQGLYSPAALEVWGNHLQQLLVAMAQCVDSAQTRTVASLEMLTGDEQQSINQLLNHAQLVEAERAKMPTSLQSLSVAQRISEQVKCNPDAVAVRFKSAQLSYAQLESRSNQLAHWLLEQQTCESADSEQTLVAIGLERGISLIVAMLGVLKAGAAYLPIDPDHPDSRIEYVLNNSGVSMLICDEQHRTRWAKYKVLALADDLSQLDDKPVVLPTLRSLHRANNDPLAYVIYTSGSTGDPKGVMVGQRALLNFIDGMQLRLGNVIAPGCHWLAVTTVSFDIAGLELWGPLIFGGQIVLADKTDVQNPQALMGLIEQFDIDVLQATPVSWQGMLAQGWQGKRSLVALCGGEPMPIELAQQLAPICGRLYNCYGPTEATIWSLVKPISVDESPQSCSHIGGGLLNYQHYVRSKLGQTVPIGAVGELYIGGESLAAGYLNAPALSAAQFVLDSNASRDGQRLYKSGDVVRLLENGQLAFVGRVDQQVKLRGHRIELGEIEYRLSNIADIEQAVVTIDQQLSYPRLVAYVVLQQPQSSQSLEQQKSNKADSWRLALAEHLPDYMIPSIFVQTQSLPRTSNGKVDRKRLALIASEHSVVQPQGPLEYAIRRCFAAVLQIDAEQVCCQSSFFDLGGDSLLTLPLLEQLNALPGCELTLKDIYARGTVEKIGQLLGQLLSQSAPLAAAKTLETLKAAQSIVKLGDKDLSGTNNKLFLLHPIVGFVNCYMDLAEQLTDVVDVYGVQAPYCYQHALRFESLAELADFYVKGILTVQPQGPFYIGGWSAGGTIACYVIERLSQLGHEVVYGLLIEPSPLAGFDGFIWTDALEAAITTILDSAIDAKDSMLLLAEQQADLPSAVAAIAQGLTELDIRHLQNSEHNQMYLNAGVDYFLATRGPLDFSRVDFIRFFTSTNEGTLGGEAYQQQWLESLNQQQNTHRLKVSGTHNQMMEGAGLEDIVAAIKADFKPSMVTPIITPIEHNQGGQK